MINMSGWTNLISFVIMVAGYFIPTYGEPITAIGAFALSGAFTNWLAIYMLFDKVPYLYGSGVVPMRFQEFKAGIKHLIVTEFFSREHIERFFHQHGAKSAQAIGESIDYDRVFEHLSDAIVDSPLGGALKMFGGKQALAPLKDPIVEKLKGVVDELASSAGDGTLTEGLVAQVEHIIDARLAELTPEKVKQIMEEMIRKHLGWLVLWGGVFGGLIGFISEGVKLFF